MTAPIRATIRTGARPTIIARALNYGAGDVGGTVTNSSTDIVDGGTKIPSGGAVYDFVTSEIDAIDIPSGSFTITDGTTSQTIGSGNTLTVVSGEGIDAVVSATDTLTISGELATSSNLGVAKFSTDSFSVSSGNVTIKTGGVTNTHLVNSSFTLGSSSVSLGGTVGTVGSPIAGEVYFASGIHSDSISVTDVTASNEIAGVVLVISEITNTTLGSNIDVSANLVLREGNSFVGNLTGTATSLATPRTISLSGDLSGSASFDGSSNISISATIGANSVALGTDTTGNYVASLVAGTGITLSNNTGEGATPTVALTNSSFTLGTSSVSLGGTVGTVGSPITGVVYFSAEVRADTFSGTDFSATNEITTVTVVTDNLTSQSGISVQGDITGDGASLLSGFVIDGGSF